MTVHVPLPLHVLLPAVFLALGALCGYFLALRSGETLALELRQYLDAFRALSARELSAQTFLQTFGCYLRAPLAAFLLGFASLGVLLIPALCFAGGFVSAFSLCCFSITLGRAGAASLLALFAVRLAVVLPCLLTLSGDALRTSYALWLLTLGGRRAQGVTYGAVHWVRFLVCCVCLLLGALAELWILSRFFAR